jgi:hypothetical protein
MCNSVIRAAPVLACAAFFVLTPASHGQDKLAGFFDPDEAKVRQVEVVEALKLICPKGAISGNGSGCRDCPKQTSFNDELGLSWDVKRVFTGHFTSVEGENLILSGRGCEPHSENFGGSFVFDMKGRSVRLLRYDEALITEKCHKFAVRDAPDMLICTDDWGAQVTLWSYVYQVAFDEDGQSDVHRIFGTIDLSPQHCGIDFFTDKPTFIQESHLTGLEMEKSPTGLPVLVVTANFGKRFPTAEERKACEQGAPIALALPTYRLEFLFDGKTFRPSEATKDSMKAFPKPESPEDSYATKH